MLESVFVLLLVTAIILLILAISWESLALCITDVVLWIVLSISIYNIEVPYQGIDGNNEIVTGTQEIQSMYPISWIFLGIAIIMMIYMFTTIIFPMLQGKFKKMM